jgi:hypothetical protein
MEPSKLFQLLELLACNLKVPDWHRGKDIE